MQTKTTRRHRCAWETRQSTSRRLSQPLPLHRTTKIQPPWNAYSRPAVNVISSGIYLTFSTSRRLARRYEAGIHRRVERPGDDGRWPTTSLAWIIHNE
ncbi:hypothetical protein [Klebsiella phage vB_KshKPC-M]|nr:hypothetical protein [Klebsiella phage vB_KshKPC-M]